jgi:hypothetical protein
MFKVAKNRTFTHEVRIFTPTDGGFTEEKLKTTFALLPVDETRNHDLKTGEGTDSFLRIAVVRFDELTDEKDQPIPYSDALRDQILKLPHVRQGVVAAYFQAIANDGPKTGN